MATFLLDCEVTSMQLRIPAAHRQALLDFFDGTRGRDCCGTRATEQGDELWLESEGGRIILSERGGTLRIRELEIFEDRGGEFFGRVVVNLLITYRGRLRCRLKWDVQGAAAKSPPAEVEVSEGETNWQGDFNRGVWLPSDERAADEGEYVEEFTGVLPEDVREKVEEARRHFEEYKRLKEQRATAKG